MTLWELRLKLAIGMLDYFPEMVSKLESVLADELRLVDQVLAEADPEQLCNPEYRARLEQRMEALKLVTQAKRNVKSYNLSKGVSDAGPDNDAAE